MIKLMREGAHKYPWVLKSIMGILAIAFVVGMGWWDSATHRPTRSPRSAISRLPAMNTGRAYENTYRYYKIMCRVISKKRP